MRERPILFKPELVRGILAAAGQLDAPPKLQTRRIVTEIKDHDRARLQAWDPFFGVATFVESIPDDPVPLDIPCRYGAEGDKLYVRETFRVEDASEGQLRYLADGDVSTFLNDSPWWRGKSRDEKWRPSIHLPRWASRITLTLAEVRVERLQDITEEDAIAEGFEPAPVFPDSARNEFREAWDRINAKRATWESNPWTWVLRWEPSGIEVRR